MLRLTSNLSALVQAIYKKQTFKPSQLERGTSIFKQKKPEEYLITRQSGI